MTIEIPEPLAAELAELFPATERDGFAVAAVAEAVLARRQQIESGMGTKVGDEEECVQAVREALVEMDAGRGLVSFEEASHRWDVQKAARRAQNQ
jgi:hypothetical protein